VIWQPDSRTISEETNKQIERLEKAFEKLSNAPSGTQCPAIDGLIKEADETAGEMLDAAIVANAQAVEHYEICRYGTLIAWAESSAMMISCVSSLDSELTPS
jgi:ferritin-like metal-binding protein YciE